MRRILLVPCALSLVAGVAAAPTMTAEEPLTSSATVKSQLGEPNHRETSKAADFKADDAVDLAKLRLREGTRLREVTGRFRQSGDSLTFIDADGREISGLPNLNLERILRMLKTVEEPESITWSVSGSITEFSGRNYLLISRAVYKAAAPPPAPESLVQPAEEKKP
jgi:hypothetical protein